LHLKQKFVAMVSATTLVSVAGTVMGASPAAAAGGCDGYANATTRTVTEGGTTSPWSYLWAPAPGTYTFCLDGPDGTELDLVLQQQPEPNGPWVTIAQTNNPGPDETLTYTDTAFPNTLYHIAVQSTRGSGTYTIGFTFAPS
jgi:hypothetical protein